MTLEKSYGRTIVTAIARSDLVLTCTAPIRGHNADIFDQGVKAFNRPRVMEMRAIAVHRLPNLKCLRNLDTVSNFYGGVRLDCIEFLSDAASKGH